MNLLKFLVFLTIVAIASCQMRLGGYSEFRDATSDDQQILLSVTSIFNSKIVFYVMNLLYSRSNQMLKLLWAVRFRISRPFELLRK